MMLNNSNYRNLQIIHNTKLQKEEMHCSKILNRLKLSAQTNYTCVSLIKIMRDPRESAQEEARRVSENVWPVDWIATADGIYRERNSI